MHRHVTTYLCRAYESFVSFDPPGFTNQIAQAKMLNTLSKSFRIKRANAKMKRQIDRLRKANPPIPTNLSWFVRKEDQIMKVLIKWEHEWARALGHREESLPRSLPEPPLVTGLPWLTGKQQVC
jgi:hypothetical protein